ncbi:MAG: gliding motility-associated C-terminal domain-containing protein [Sphingobacteriales bacterium]|nr:gliding motility-associated C-terminal domain-containing protein [Sphingobacteriales bacterium]
MKRILILLVCILTVLQSVLAQLNISISTTPSTCSSNGSIMVNASGSSFPYFYQITSSSSGIVRPLQNANIFQNLPSGNYSVRVSDANNTTKTTPALISGNYTPLSFSHTQVQSSVIIQANNGKGPYKYAYSPDGGFTYTTPSDSNTFRCMTSGNYIFRVTDSCENFYSEAVAVNPVTVNMDFSCIENGSNRSIRLNSIISGNGGYIFHAYGNGYDETNSNGHFSNITKCNRNIQIDVKDQCSLSNRFEVCPFPNYTYEVACVNFKNNSVTLTNISGGNNIPFVFTANGSTGNSAFIQNIPNTQDSIVVGITDSCDLSSTVKINKMKILKQPTVNCPDGGMIVNTFIPFNGTGRSFPPTRFQSISGPTSFDETDSISTDTTQVSFYQLVTGSYKYKITNACGDEVIDSFSYSKQCYSALNLYKYQSCNGLRFRLEKDCATDTTALYTLKDMNGRIVAQNRNGIFSSIDNDSCYKMEVRELVCDTILTDYVHPVGLQLGMFQNSCNELSLRVSLYDKKNCGTASTPRFADDMEYILCDSTLNILMTNNTGLINSIPADTYWIYARGLSCNSDTVRYLKTGGFSDTVRFCLTPSLKLVNSKCTFAWKVKLLNNRSNINFSLVGNGTIRQSSTGFSGVDTGHYVLKDGCNEQPLFLPDYYHFRSSVNPGCPSNASITAGYDIDSLYIDSLSRKYFFELCDLPEIDYNIRELDTGNPLVYSYSGLFNNLKTGTYHVVYYKGDEFCSHGRDTLFTSFYARPALSATYGLICNNNRASVKAMITGGTPPYSYEVLNSTIRPITTNSNFVLYDSMPLGTAQFRVSDACGISTDYSTEVLNVDFEPTYRKKCNGQVQLIAPDIFNATYIWTNKHGDTIGHTPGIYAYPSGDDTFHVSIKYLNCTFHKNIYVTDISGSTIRANAGMDIAIDTTVIFLHANTAGANTTGTWRQVHPSSGNTYFYNIHDANTKISVAIFPGQYTYVWTLNDTANGCISEDTVVVSFVRCPGIKPVLYSKQTVLSSCTNNAQITIAISQSSTPVHFIWNTGDTSSILKNLSNGIYTVRIFDETNCTEDALDTIYINGSQSSFSTFARTICDGDSITINNKKYFTGGIYTDTLQNSVGCDSILTVRISLLNNSSRHDTVYLCEENSYVLPDGQVITRSGNYMVKLTNLVGCDSLLHYHIRFNAASQKITDTAICAGLSYTLPNGNTTQQSGIYNDTFHNVYGCDSIIITKLRVKDALTKVNLGENTLICDGDTYTISLNYPSNVRFIWLDNSTLPSFSINAAGIYAVRVFDECTVTTDTISIGIKDCSCNFYIPSAFSPNDDGYNDIFKPFANCVFFEDYTLSVYNRWGELIFHTTETEMGWDGKYKNEIQPIDTYIWILEYDDILGNLKIRKNGNLTLLR